MEQPEGVSPSRRALVARKLKRIPGGGHGHRRRGAGTPWGTKDRFAEVEERDGRRQGVEARPGQHPLRHEYPKISHTSDPWPYPLARPTQAPGSRGRRRNVVTAVGWQRDTRAARSGRRKSNLERRRPGVGE